MRGWQGDVVTFEAKKWCKHLVLLKGEESAGGTCGTRAAMTPLCDTD